MSLKELRKRPCVLSTFIYVTHHCSTRNCVDRSKNFNYILFKNCAYILTFKNPFITLKNFLFELWKTEYPKSSRELVKTRLQFIQEIFSACIFFWFYYLQRFQVWVDKIKIRKQNLMYLEVSNICIYISF